jgi:hypothetical protein
MQHIKRQGLFVSGFFNGLVFDRGWMLWTFRPNHVWNCNGILVVYLQIKHE